MSIEKQIIEILKKKFCISVYHSRHRESGYELCIDNSDGATYAEISEEEYELFRGLDK